MYPHKYSISNNYQNMYRNSNKNFVYPMTSNPNEERFFWAPFVVGGLAGTALGYGIANNNQLNQGPRPIYPYPIYPTPYPIYPTYSSTNYYY